MARGPMFDRTETGVFRMEIRTIGVVGAGQMGNGIAHVFALAGFDVQMNDISAEALDRAVSTIRANLGAGSRTAACTLALFELGRMKRDELTTAMRVFDNSENYLSFA